MCGVRCSTYACFDIILNRWRDADGKKVLYSDLSGSACGRPRDVAMWMSDAMSGGCSRYRMMLMMIGRGHGSRTGRPWGVGGVRAGRARLGWGIPGSRRT